MNLEMMWQYVQLGHTRSLLAFSIRGPSKAQPADDGLASMRQKLGVFTGFSLIFLATAFCVAAMGPWGFYQVTNALQLVLSFKLLAFKDVVLVLLAVAVALLAGIGVIGKTVDEHAALGTQGRQMWLALALLAPLFAGAIEAADVLTRESIFFLVYSLPGAEGLQIPLVLMAATASMTAGAWLYVALCRRRFSELAGSRFSADPLAKRRVLQLSLYIFGVTFLGLFFAVGAVKELRDPQGQHASAALIAGRPVMATVLACSAEPATITCAMTLWPQDIHDITYAGNWSADLETGKQADGSIAVLRSVDWRPSGDSRKLPLVTLQPARRQDVELTAGRSDACALEAASRAAAASTHIFFNVKGRFNHLEQNERALLRINPTNIETWRSEIRRFCAAG